MSLFYKLFPVIRLNI